MSVTSTNFSEEPTWFGPAEVPLFGWLTLPTSPEILGGVVIVPSVGYEARSAKRALRYLARQLGAAGFMVLRFDLRGTGDSSKDFNEVLPNPDWISDVAHAVGLLRSHDVQSVSVVGMRLGATLISSAITEIGIDITSVVLWDPCESGQSYLRELRALESLRRSQRIEGEDGSVETAEFLFPPEMARSLRSIKASSLGVAGRTARALVITRTSRPLSTTLRRSLESNRTEFRTTDEQEELLNVLPFDGTLPVKTTVMIVSWLREGGLEQRNNPVLALQSETILRGGEGTVEIYEHAKFLGEQNLFAVLTVPAQTPIGPWIVIIGNVHEDHTGQSRLWVELSRRWAQVGLRCARVDLSGLGESAEPHHARPLDRFDSRWVDDVVTVGNSLDQNRPSNTVFVGFCAGAELAMEGALALHSQGICVINPPLERNVMHAVMTLRHSQSRVSRFIAKYLNRLFVAHGRITITGWETLRKVFPRKWSHDILQEIRANGSNIFVLGSPDDLSLHSKVPLLRFLERRHAEAIKKLPYTLVPDLDHDMTNAGGRAKIVTLLEEHIRKTYAHPIEEQF